MISDGNFGGRKILAGPGRREVRLSTKPFNTSDLDGSLTLLRNRWTMIYPGVDVERIVRAEAESREFEFGCLAIGEVEREAVGGAGPKLGDLIYWAGPHADHGAFDPAREVWAPAPRADPLLLPAGIGTEAQYGLELAIANAPMPASCVVIGQGMLGHLAGQWLRRRGASVTVVENSPKRLEFSKYTGLVQRVDTHNLRWLRKAERFNPAGVDLIVEACGSGKPLLEILPLLNSGGLICRLGEWRRDDPDELAGALVEKKARCSGPTPAFSRAPDSVRETKRLREWIELIANGEIETERLVTDRVDPVEGCMHAKRLAAGVKSIVGVAIDWSVDPSSAATSLSVDS